MRESANSPQTAPEQAVTATPSEPAISETIPEKTVATTASEPVAAAPVPERTVSLTWDSAKESVQGYRIFMGPTADAASMSPIEELEAQAGPQQTVSLVVSELDVKPGEEVCFRVQAFRSAQVSDYSEALCHTP